MGFIIPFLKPPVRAWQVRKCGRWWEGLNFPKFKASTEQKKDVKVQLCSIGWHRQKEIHSSPGFVWCFFNHERTTNPSQVSSQSIDTGRFGFLILTSAVYYLGPICQNWISMWALPNLLSSSPNYLQLCRLLKETWTRSSITINIFKLHAERSAWIIVPNYQYSKSNGIQWVHNKF